MTVEPRTPYPGLRERRQRELQRVLDETQPPHSAHEGAPAQVHARIADRVDALRGDLTALATDLHEHPELAYAEHHAAAAIASVLERHGVRTEVGAYGLPTAIRAVCHNDGPGNNGPTVAVIAEYDGLPGIGHACGHNIIAASAVGAFLALAEEFGTVELIGTPAEEGGGGKQRILDADGFEHVDFALMAHPGNLDVAGSRSLGFRQVAVTYRGIAAHSATGPHLGVNALDAVVAAYTGIAQLRQHILPSDKVHGIITDGGQAPNIVPETASAVFYVRSLELDTLAELHTRVDTILRAAADATGTAADVSWDNAPPYLPLRTNNTLEARYAVALSGRRSVLPTAARPVEEVASTDMGNVSLAVPAIHPIIAIAPRGVANHTAEFAKYAADAQPAILDAAVGLAGTAADFLHDEQLRSDARAEFDRLGGPVSLRDALAKEQTA
ncbi:M20 family metallopeptidase [Sciscionella marina]|uniref:M20 family metallopeptidase n=1 Tax=Sciscionella marina TaxID=508770 RepID=UPI0003703F38|nr:M20 family metallopeptidase [Sciscionella marina]